MYSYDDGSHSPRIRSVHLEWDLDVERTLSPGAAQ